MVARGPSAPWVPLPLVALCEKLVLVLPRRGRIHIDAQPDSPVALVPALTPHLCLSLAGAFLITDTNLCIYWSALLVFLVVYHDAANLFCMPVDNDGTKARYLSLLAGPILHFPKNIYRK